MKSLLIKAPEHPITADVNLPASKSICNRALILKQVLSNVSVSNISTADDSVIMQHALQQTSGVVDVKNAGTCMRFLTAYYAATPGCDLVLQGSERMHKRPIGALVDVLKSVGASIDYLQEPEYPPLKIKGQQLNGGLIKLDASVSSQFTSALMLIAPLLKQLLKIDIGSNVVSKPYLHMTAQLLQQAGVKVLFKDLIVIDPTPISNTSIDIAVEPDWSAASYWYIIAALKQNSNITLRSLSNNSIQGDALMADVMKHFGVNSSETSYGVQLSPSPINQQEQTSISMVNTPDLVPALAVLFCALNMAVEITDVAHLEVKESNRLTALCTELSKCGFQINHNGNTLFIHQTDPSKLCAPKEGFNTYHDHRMAMAFAPLCLLFDEIIINNPEVVEKSYPEFWLHLAEAGFTCTAI
jgi:3-phosphoshikimate 1-carboxyvinyltransferase